MKIFPIKLDDSLHNRIKVESVKTYKTMNLLIEEALREKFKD